MQTQDQSITEYMEQGQTDIERDLLLLEVAQKLKLTDDMRFWHFFRYCEKFQEPSFRDLTDYSMEEYKERLKEIIKDLAKDDRKTNEIVKLESALRMIYRIFTNPSLDELTGILHSSFTNYSLKHGLDNNDWIS